MAIVPDQDDLISSASCNASLGDALMAVRSLLLSALRGDHSEDHHARIAAFQKRNAYSTHSLVHLYCAYAFAILGRENVPIQIPDNVLVLDEPVEQAEDVPNIFAAAEFAFLLYCYGIEVELDSYKERGASFLQELLLTRNLAGEVPGCFFQPEKNEAHWSIEHVIACFEALVHGHAVKDDANELLLRLSYRYKDAGGRSFSATPTISGMYSHTTERGVMFSTTLGARSGIFSYYSNECAVVNMGPHHFPLGVMEHFGVVNSASCATDVSGALFAGCAPVAEKCSDEESYPMMWLSWKIFENDSSGVDVQTHFFGREVYLPLALAIFVRAEGVEINGQSIRKCSLDKYRGECTPVVFHGARERMNVDAAVDTEMQVLPLAGGHHFWGADFVIAYGVTASSRSIRLKIF